MKPQKYEIHSDFAYLIAFTWEMTSKKHSFTALASQRKISLWYTEYIVYCCNEAYSPSCSGLYDYCKSKLSRYQVYLSINHNSTVFLSTISLSPIKAYTFQTLSSYARCISKKAD
jgi:hypothetical protein